MGRLQGQREDMEELGNEWDWRVCYEIHKESTKINGRKGIAA